MVRLLLVSAALLPQSFWALTGDEDNCTEFLSANGSHIHDVQFWSSECKNIPNNASSIKVRMGLVTDYFRPSGDNTLCLMLQSSQRHMWSPDGISWVIPAYNALDHQFGGSAYSWPQQYIVGDRRGWLSSWGSSGRNRGGCCHASSIDNPGWGRSFTMFYCTQAGLARVAAPIAGPSGAVAAVAAAATGAGGSAEEEIDKVGKFHEIVVPVAFGLLVALAICFLGVSSVWRSECSYLRKSARSDSAVIRRMTSSGEVTAETACVSL